MQDTKLHSKARQPGPTYPAKFNVPDEFVLWTVPYAEYKPVEFTAANLLKSTNPAVDPAETKQLSQKLLTRISFEMPKLNLDSSGRPINPRGRTGMTGRGKLYKWGPNHAVDPLVTRPCKSIHSSENKDLFEFVAIKRGDSGAWALPGGMVDEGEDPKDAVRREFCEEVVTEEVLKHDAEQTRLVEQIFGSIKNHNFKGQLIYQGYVDDPRNTDNAWIETSVYRFHIADPQIAQTLMLRGGDDATAAKWVVAQKGVQEYDNLYANHREFVDLALRKSSI